MILLDTNVLVDCMDKTAINHAWAIHQVIAAVAGAGGAVNAVIVAELCAGDRDPGAVSTELRKLGVQIFDLPMAAASICGQAYRRYKLARMSSGGSNAPTMPLPDFFIGAHAQLMGWKVSTRDPERFRKYFPSVMLLTP
jgi:hypothetical protein